MRHVGPYQQPALCSVPLQVCFNQEQTEANLGEVISGFKSDTEGMDNATMVGVPVKGTSACAGAGSPGWASLFIRSLFLTGWCIAPTGPGGRGCRFRRDHGHCKEGARLLCGCMRGSRLAFARRNTSLHNVTLSHVQSPCSLCSWVATPSSSPPPSCRERLPFFSPCCRWCHASCWWPGCTISPLKWGQERTPGRLPIHPLISGLAADAAAAAHHFFGLPVQAVGCGLCGRAGIAYVAPRLSGLLPPEITVDRMLSIPGTCHPERGKTHSGQRT